MAQNSLAEAVPFTATPKHRTTQTTNTTGPTAAPPRGEATGLQV